MVLSDITPASLPGRFISVAGTVDPYLKDRVGKGNRDPDAEIRVDNLALCILGGIQPDRLAKFRDLTSDGLLQRFLPVLMAPAERGDEYHPVAASRGTTTKS